MTVMKQTVSVANHDMLLETEIEVMAKTEVYATVPVASKVANV